MRRVFQLSSNFYVRGAGFGGVPAPNRSARSGGAISFYDETLYGLDDEMDEYGDTGA